MRWSFGSEMGKAGFCSPELLIVPSRKSFQWICVMNQLSARLFNCRYCHAQASVCPGCDKGQAYCSEECRTAARREQLRRANQTYSRSIQGREKTSKRVRAHRRRKVEVQSPNVTYLPEPQPSDECAVGADFVREAPHSTIGTVDGACADLSDSKGAAEPMQVQDNDEEHVSRAAPRCVCCGVSARWIDIRASMRGRSFSQRARRSDRRLRPHPQAGLPRIGRSPAHSSFEFRV